MTSGSRTIRVGLAGCGFAGNLHSRSLVLAKISNIGQRVNPVFEAVADTNIARAQKLAKQYGWNHVEKNWENLFTHNLDLVIVALPNSEHLAIVEKASKLGVAVLLEKPIASTYEESLGIVRASKSNARIRVGYVNRFVPAVQRAKEYIIDGKLGEIRMIRSVYLLNMRRPGGSIDWRFDKTQGGNGASDDLGSHHIDLLQFLVGKISSVQASSRTWNIKDAPSTNNDDALNAILNLENNAFGTLTASRTSPGHPLTGYIEIDGELGTLRIDRAYLNDLFIRDINGVISQKNIRPVDHFAKMWTSATVQGAHPFSWYDCFAFQILEMLFTTADIELETSWLATVDDGLSAMSVGDALIKSSKTGHIENVKTMNG